MSRLTNRQYLKNTRWLREIWNSNLKSLYSLHSLWRQWDLHAYFAPSKDWTDEERIEHRILVTKDFPDLPARAGRYFSAMRQLYDEAAKACKCNEHLIQPYISDVVAPLKIDKSGRSIGIAGIARAEPDLRGFAKALIQLAQDRVSKESETDKAA